MTDPLSPPKTPSRRPRLALVAALLLAAAGVGVYVATRADDAPPPLVSLDELDPDVAALVREARDEALTRPRHAPAWGRLGLVYFANNLYDESRICFARAEELDPSQPRWPYFQGLILLRSDADAGIVKLRQATERTEGSPHPYLRLAEALLAADRLDDAEPLFRRLAQAPDLEGRGSLGLGLIASRRGQFADAVAPLRRATADPTARKAARGALAEVLARQGNADAADAERRAEAALPDDAPWHDPFLAEAERYQTGTLVLLGRADVLAGRGQYDEARATLDRLLEAHPEVEEAYVKRARIALARNQPDRAEEDLRTALARKGDLIDAHFLLGGVLLLKNKADEAEASYRRTVALKPGHAVAHFNLGQCLRRKGDKAGALAAYRAALVAGPHLADVHAETADLLAEMGKTAEAQAHVGDALRLAPGHEKARQLRARLSKS